MLAQNRRRAESCQVCKWFTKCYADCNASAFMNGDMRNKYEFSCYFTTQVFAFIEKLLRSYDSQKTNRYANEIIEKAKQAGKFA